jgi:RNA polymerase sigma-70 factor, ECF subfamily
MTCRAHTATLIRMTKHDHLRNESMRDARPLRAGSLPDHLTALTREARRLCRSREDAEDLVQETLTRILSRPRLIHVDERHYLLRALRNAFYSRLRERARRPQVVEVFAELDPERDAFGHPR